MFSQNRDSTARFPLPRATRAASPVHLTKLRSLLLLVRSQTVSIRLAHRHLYRPTPPCTRQSMCVPLAGRSTNPTLFLHVSLAGELTNPLRLKGGTALFEAWMWESSSGRCCSCRRILHLNITTDTMEFFVSIIRMSGFKVFTRAFIIPARKQRSDSMPLSLLVR